MEAQQTQARKLKEHIENYRSDNPLENSHLEDGSSGGEGTTGGGVGN